MTIELTAQGSNAIQSGQFTPQIVIDIKDYPLLVSGNSFKLDSRRSGKNIPDYYLSIDLKGSTREVNQQLQLEKGGSSSTSTFKARLVDKDKKFTSLFSFVTQNKEILERDARVFFGFEGGEYPKDFVPFINGTVGNINFGSGYADISINHPDKNKKQEIFLPKSSELAFDIDDVTTTIELVDAQTFLLPALGFRTFIRIDDEIIEYTGISGNILTGVIRGALTSIAKAHDAGDELESFYELSGDSIDLPLRLYLSGSGVTDSDEVYAINDDGTVFIQNAIFFNDNDFREIIGASLGDLVNLVSISNPLNDFTNRKIVDYGQVNNRSYYVVDGSNLNTELIPDASASFQSQHDVLPDGAGLKMHQVDLVAFERINTLFPTRRLQFNRYIKEDLDLDKFVNEEVFLPSSFYHLPRKGKLSIGVFNPPLTDLNTVRINEKAITSQFAKNIVVERSVGKHFYNFIQAKTNEDSVEDTLLSTRVFLSADSTSRIPAKNKGLKIESGGLRVDSATMQKLETNTQRILERYQFAAEQIKAEVLYKVGLKVEIGDAVVFGSDILQVSDSTRGDRKFQPRVMQCINKAQSFTGSPVKLTLLDTNYSIFARYGIISPASKVLTVNANKILGKPVCDSIIDSEQETWTPFISTRVQLRLPDFSYSEEFTIKDVSSSGEIFLDASPNLSFLPLNNGQQGALNKTYTELDLIIESIQYPQNTNPKDQELWKDTYVYFNPRLVITNVIDESNFEVSSLDLSAITEKSFIVVHDTDFVNLSQEVTVKEINSNLITLNVPLNYLPSVGDEVDLVGFIDGGFPYRWF